MAGQKKFESCEMEELAVSSPNSLPDPFLGYLAFWGEIEGSHRGGNSRSGKDDDKQSPEVLEIGDMRLLAGLPG